MNSQYYDINIMSFCLSFYLLNSTWAETVFECMERHMADCSDVDELSVNREIILDVVVNNTACLDDVVKILRIEDHIDDIDCLRAMSDDISMFYSRDT